MRLPISGGAKRFGGGNVLGVGLPCLGHIVCQNWSLATVVPPRPLLVSPLFPPPNPPPSNPLPMATCLRPSASVGWGGDSRGKPKNRRRADLRGLGGTPVAGSRFLAHNMLLDTPPANHDSAPFRIYANSPPRYRQPQFRPPEHQPNCSQSRKSSELQQAESTAQTKKRGAKTPPVQE